MRGCRWQFVLAQVLSMVCAAMLLINPIISQNIIDQVIVGVTDPVTKQTTHHVEFLVPLVVLLIGASLLRDIFYYLMLMFAEKSSQRTGVPYPQQAVSKYAAAGYELLCQKPHG